MDIDSRPTGPALAEALGGTFDLDNGTVRFAGRPYFIRCAITGKVGLVLEGGVQVTLGRMSEGVDTLAREFSEALTERDEPFPEFAEPGDADPHMWPSLGWSR